MCEYPLIQQLEKLHDVLINGTEAVDPKWDRLAAASAVGVALEWIRNQGCEGPHSAHKTQPEVR